MRRATRLVDGGAARSRTAEVLPNMQVVKIGVALGWLLAGIWLDEAHGDGGTVRLSVWEGTYRITVFTSPTPFRVGPVDISVLVQDVVTGEAIPEARVTVRLTPRGHAGETIRHVATTEAATNKLFHAAVFELPESGRWEGEIAIENRRGPAQVHFELVAAGPAPRWPAMWPWIGWPFPVILLFSIHQLLVWRKRHRPA